MTKHLNKLTIDSSDYIRNLLPKTHILFITV